VFLVGFPRSGTTLLDQLLDSHPAIQVIEEQPMIDIIKNSIAQLPDGYPGALPALSDADLIALRDAYFKLLDRRAETTPGQLVIDKFPLNLTHLPLILNLFPDARILLAIRHPCDVVLSCFMQPFNANNAMENFHSVKECAFMYEQVMGLWFRYRELFDFNHMMIRYEDVITEFGVQTDTLFSFLDLEVHDEVGNFSQHARNRGRIATPSYNQVSRPIYKDAMYRWKKYRQYLEPELPRLNRFIDAFGYSQ